MSTVRFKVRSSDKTTIYHVAASRISDRLILTCECRAGANGQHCKHRLDLLRGDARSVIDLNEDDLAELADMALGTELLQMLKDLDATDREVQRLSSKLKSTKKAIAALMEPSPRP